MAIIGARRIHLCDHLRNYSARSALPRAFGGALTELNFYSRLFLRLGARRLPSTGMPTNRTDGFTRTSLKLMAPLIASVVVVSLIYAVYQVNSQSRSMRRDLQRRSEVLADSLQETAEAGLVTHTSAGLKRSIERVVHRDQIVGIAVFDSAASSSPPALASTPPLQNEFAPKLANARQATSCNQFFYSGPTWFHLYIQPLGAFRPLTKSNRAGNWPECRFMLPASSSPNHPTPLPANATSPSTSFGWLVILNDATYIHTATNRMWRDSLLHAFFQCLLIALLAFLMIRWTLRDSITRIASWMKAPARRSPPPPAQRRQPPRAARS